MEQEWMNECLMTPQHEKQIGYWVSDMELELFTLIIIMTIIYFKKKIKSNFILFIYLLTNVIHFVNGYI